MPSSENLDRDLEKHYDEGAKVEVGEASNERFSGIRKVSHAIDMFETKLGMETRGIERVKPEDQDDRRIWGTGVVWLAANLVLTTFGIGILGPGLFYLGLGDSMLTVFFTNTISALIPAYLATFGPQLGLRQMTSARFSWGYWGARIVALLNCVACVGWSIVNTIAGAQTLRVIALEKISHAAGVVIIAVVTLVIGCFGYKIVHVWQTWAWIPCAISMIALFGCACQQGLFNTPMGTGQLEASNVLSFMGVIFGYVIGWTSLASDYCVYQPSTTPPWKTFAWTYAGMTIPLVTIEWLGCIVMSAANAHPDWWDAYDSEEVGGLIGAVFRPVIGKGGAGFFMFWLVMSVVSNNIVNVYSMGLSIAVVSGWLAKLPRLIWPIVITAIYIPLAIVGANSFATSLSNFMAVLGYWLSIFVAVVLVEHFVFRKGNFENYNVAESWNNPHLLPLGFGALAAFCAGCVGTWLGMAEVFYIGPVGAKIGGTVNEYGGDIGFEMSGAFAAIIYLPARWLEIKYLGR